MYSLARTPHSLEQRQETILRAAGNLRWEGTQEEADVLLDSIHASATCSEYGQVDCCDSDLYQLNCPAHTLLDNQDYLDLMLRVMRGRVL